MVCIHSRIATLHLSKIFQLLSNSFPNFVEAFVPSSPWFVLTGWHIPNLFSSESKEEEKAVQRIVFKAKSKILSFGIKIDV